ncbi:MAG: hypothetical protein LBB89_05775 [Treponema sp.]|jgi:hypothetical protein|nr:hypothetical protein [Treponema sp.]
MKSNGTFSNVIVCAVLLTLLGIIIPLRIGAAETDSGDVDFNIRFFDRRIYYVEGDPIYIQVTISNNSPATYRFKLADERVFSLEFDVKTVSNRQLEPADILTRKRTQYQQVFFREIAVESGESFSFVEDLRNYVNVKEPGSLVVKAYLYPELFRSGISKTAALGGSSAPAVTFGTLESKRLSLSIRPPVVTGPDGIPLEMDIATNATLVRERFAPDQVVEYMLSARQKSQWEKFFLYLDLEAMLSRDAVNQRKWLAESEEGRRRMIEQFRQELRSEVRDGTISVIPTDFSIEQTQYNSFEGSVTVLEKFRSKNRNNNNEFTELKRYTYSVRLKDNIWTIVDYSVVNLGTE